MNIRASKKDDLIREKNEWQMKHDARKQLYRDQEGRYDEAVWNWKDTVAALVKKEFSSYISKLPNLEISTDIRWGGGIELRFRYADGWLSHEDRERISLRWDYSITLTDKGEITKETNSWSGFNAANSAQVDDLLNSANFLKAIVDYDWVPLLEEAKSSRPRYSQYVGINDPDRDPEYKDPGYDRMIKEAEVEDALSGGNWIKIDSDWGSGRWVYIISETPKFYTYTSVGDWEVTHATPSNTNIDTLTSHITDPKNVSSYYIDRIKKDKFRFTNPIQTKTPEELAAMIGSAVQ